MRRIVPFRLHAVRQVFDVGKHWGGRQVDHSARSGADRGRSTWNIVRDLVADLKSCAKQKDLQQGRRVHEHAAGTGDDSNIYVAAALINMYAKCCSMAEAQQVFDRIEKPDIVSWNALLMGYAVNGQGQTAFDLFLRMKAARLCAPNAVTYVAATKACASMAAAGGRESLKRGRVIHSEIGSQMDHFLQNALIDMYAKCGSMPEAQEVFDGIQKPDVVSWTSLIMGYADNGQSLDALDLFARMRALRVCEPNAVTYVAAIKACTLLAAAGDEAAKEESLKRGKAIHAEIGRCMGHFVQNALIEMYSKCCSIVDARQVFDRMQHPDVVSWTSLIMGYAENGQGETALGLFSRMKRVCEPDSMTYVAAIKACTSLAAAGNESGMGEALKQGRQIHSEIGRHHLDQQVVNTLIDMYAKCGSMSDAQKAFDRVKKPDVVSWTSLIMGYADNGQAQVSLDFFSRMNAAKCEPNSVTYIAAIKACTSAAATGKERESLQRGKEIHLQVGHHMDYFVQSTLIHMYAKCRSMADAHQVFDTIPEPNVVCWNAVITGYADNGQGQAALNMFSRMKRVCAPDSMTYVAAVKACTSLAAAGDEAGKEECLKRGRELHSETGHQMDHFVQNSLIDMYAKCGSMVDAQQLFDTMQDPNVVSWNALILGYAANGQGEAALDLFSRMKDSSKCAPNSVTYLAALKACASTGALALGARLHREMTSVDAHVVTCLVDFYSKCGSMAEAREVFDSHPNCRDVSTWNALLAGYASFGDSGAVFNLFEAMQEQSYRPDAVTFGCMLLCCSHGGLVKKASEYLEAMPVRYGVTPRLMHYNSMVDVLGRANQLDKAVALLQKMPCSPDAVTWTALLGACRKWKNVEMGRLAFQSLVDLDDKFAGHVAMAQIYGGGVQRDQERVLEAGDTERTL